MMKRPMYKAGGKTLKPIDKKKKSRTCEIT